MTDVSGEAQGHEGYMAPNSQNPGGQGGRSCSLRGNGSSGLEATRPGRTSQRAGPALLRPPSNASRPQLAQLLPALLRINFRPGCTGRSRGTARWPPFSGSPREMVDFIIPALPCALELGGLRFGLIRISYICVAICK